MSNFVILRPPIYTFIVSLYGKPQFDLSYLYASTMLLWALDTKVAKNTSLWLCRLSACRSSCGLLSWSARNRSFSYSRIFMSACLAFVRFSICSIAFFVQTLYLLLELRYCTISSLQICPTYILIKSGLKLLHRIKVCCVILHLICKPNLISSK